MFENYIINNMKKILILVLSAFLLLSCYDDYVKDFSHTTVAFSNATGGATTPNTQYRTVVIGEGLQLEAGVYLGGVRQNTKDRWVEFEIDPSLLDQDVYSDYKLMPEEYYKLTEKDRFVIPKGDFIGKTTIVLDSALFTSDNMSAKYHYAIPLKITQASSVDSIHTSQNFQILVIKYINFYEGYYDQVGSFITYSPDGEELNSGSIKNDLYFSTTSGSSVRSNGMMATKGPEFMMNLQMGNDDSFSLEYFPNPDPVEPANIALDATPSTDYVSTWETLEAINSGYSNPENSGDNSHGIYGNWHSGGQWRYVQYDFDGFFMINQSDVYWFTDNGGLLMPTDNYLEYWDIDEDKWVRLSDAVGNGAAESEWNITTFDPVVTNRIRLNMINDTESVGIIQWQVWGVPAPVGLEASPIEKVTLLDDSSFDRAAETFKLNYRVDYLVDDYYTEVSVNLKWRNRIRDGVNEWQR